MSDRMPKIDAKQIKQRELDVMKRIELQNLERVQKLKKLRKANLLTAGLLGTAVLGIYGYSMYAVAQESFLDDFEEPAKVTQ